MRTSRLVILPLAGLVALAVLSIGLLSSQAAANGTSHVPPDAPLVRTPPGPSTGMPAIAPRSNAAVALSVSDVQTFVEAHGFRGGAAVPGHAVTILSIRLMTRQQANALGAELAAYTNTTMVYVVKMEGPFYNTNVKTIAGGPTTSLVGYEIFDAHTGNMLEWGVSQSLQDGI